jgi:universal stress protein family protein
VLPGAGTPVPAAEMDQRSTDDASRTVAEVLDGVIVRRPQPVGDGNAPIVVGKDGSANGELALDWALDLRNAVGGQVVAVHAWQAGVSEVRPGLWERLETAARESVEGRTAAHDDVRAVEMKARPVKCSPRPRATCTPRSSSSIGGAAAETPASRSAA